MPVELVPLSCTNCHAPLPGAAGEMAWVCAQCGQGVLLGDDGPTPISASFGGLLSPGAQGKPFWVAEGRVSVQMRESFDRVGVMGLGDQAGQSREWWEQTHTFYIPAYACTPTELVELGTQLLLSPPVVRASPAGPFQPVVLTPGEVAPLAEAVVMNVEYERKDKLKEFNFTLALESPRLVILP